MRWLLPIALRGLTLLLQIVIPAVVAVSVAIGMGLVMGSGGIATWILAVIVIGAVIGFFVWLPGLIVDRASLSRLVLTVALSILGGTGTALMALFFHGSQSPLIFFASYAVPIGGAMAGYYWSWRKPHVEGQ
jgi:hypothetical protein